MLHITPVQGGLLCLGFQLPPACFTYFNYGTVPGRQGLCGWPLSKLQGCSGVKHSIGGCAPALEAALAPTTGDGAASIPGGGMTSLAAAGGGQVAGTSKQLRRVQARKAPGMGSEDQLAGSRGGSNPHSHTALWTLLSGVKL